MTPCSLTAQLADDLCNPDGADAVLTESDAVDLAERIMASQSIRKGMLRGPLGDPLEPPTVTVVRFLVRVLGRRMGLTSDQIDQATNDVYWTLQGAWHFAYAKGRIRLTV